METEPKIEKSVEEKLREKGYIIEPVKDVLTQCDNDSCFSEAKCYIEGSFYCSEHKENAIKSLEEIDKDAERIKKEQEFREKMRISNKK